MARPHTLQQKHEETVGIPSRLPNGKSNPAYRKAYKAKRRLGGICRDCNNSRAVQYSGGRCFSCWKKHNERRNNSGNRIHRPLITDWYFNLYETLLAEQIGVCAICGKEEKKRRLAVDHKHENADGSGRHRGLLCSRCNQALERLENHDGWEQKARAYLNKWEEAWSIV